jgi:hypothetical protein
MHVDGIEALDNHVGSGGVELVRIVMACDADTIHIAGFRRLDTHPCILHHKALARRHPQRPRSGEKERGIGLTARHIQAIHVCIKQIEESRLRVDERIA